MKVKVRKKPAPAVECGKRADETEVIPFLTSDIGGYRHRKKTDESEKMLVNLHRRLQLLKRAECQKTPQNKVTCENQVKLRSELIPEVSEKSLRYMVAKLSEFFDKNKNNEVFRYIPDCMLSDFIRKIR